MRVKWEMGLQKFLWESTLAKVSNFVTLWVWFFFCGQFFPEHLSALRSPVCPHHSCPLLSRVRKTNGITSPWELAKPTASKLPLTRRSSDTTNQRTRSVNRAPDPVRPGRSRNRTILFQALSLYFVITTHRCFQCEWPFNPYTNLHTQRTNLRHKILENALFHNPLLDGSPSSQLTDPQPRFTKLFNVAYNEFYRNDKLSERTR